MSAPATESPGAVDGPRPARPHDAGRLGELDDRRGLSTFVPSPVPPRRQHRHLLPLRRRSGAARSGVRLAVRVGLGQLRALDRLRRESAGRCHSISSPPRRSLVAALVVARFSKRSSSSSKSSASTVSSHDWPRYRRSARQRRSGSSMSSARLLHRGEALLGVGAPGAAGARRRAAASDIARPSALSTPPARGTSSVDAELLGQRAGVQPAGAADATSANSPPGPARAGFD